MILKSSIKTVITFEVFVFLHFRNKLQRTFQKSYNILPTPQQKKQHRTVKTCMETERRQETIQYSMESPEKMQALQQRN